jgi:calcium-dependent protein kinase
VNSGYGSLRVLEESVARQFMGQILEAFAYMHALYKDEYVIHRDLKFENIFIHKVGEEIILKVGDFGFAKVLSKGTSATSCKGSPLTMAPEVWKGKYNQKCDIYSMGVIFYQMLFGLFPYDKSPPGLEFKIQNKQMKFHKWNSQVSEETKKTIERMLEYNVEKRITFKEMFKLFEI